MKKKILVLPGDGVGPEVCDAALMILEQFQFIVKRAITRLEIENEVNKKSDADVRSDLSQ
ncbi:hypothetical protein KAE70_00975 [Bartonella henselae]|uniref:hypothetical protein n=1 Tax=Bartonella henselae TaxID=38323 RepID=UPI00095BE57A|nr:hypothetical protein [Bartonella henselae]OLL55150.1 hypothetical protein AT239_00040 [Bartonella henselae]OLL56897.1 hypothetical protein AT240_04670 [Bartonella henselae]UJM33127.1 hypothetical protein KAE70_00975 [Bartonella henselae]